MSIPQLEDVINNSDFIVAGYAFTLRQDNNVSIVCVAPPHHAALIDLEGNVLETNMDDIELEIVTQKYWHKNKKHLLDPEYA